MGSVTVRTRAELVAAKNSKASEIIVLGKLAEDLKKTKKLAKLGIFSLGVLIAGIGLAPVTGGVSGAATMGFVAAKVGVDVATIIVASAIGLGVILAIAKNYDEIEVGPMRLKLKRKSGK